MRERGWRDEEFDFVLQFLRTILLKRMPLPTLLHRPANLPSDGGTLIYTTPSSPSLLQPLIYSMLAIPSPLRSQPVKHNVIDRDKVLVPPHWDSWGKIRVLREGFDVEGINIGWSADISLSHADDEVPESSAVEVFEDVIKDTGRNGSDLAIFKGQGRALEFPPVDTQEFLAGQFEILEAKAAEDRGARAGERGKKGAREADDSTERVLAEQVGPVQFNVGGIQVDADNMLESLKVWCRLCFFFWGGGADNACSCARRVEREERLRRHRRRRSRRGSRRMRC